MLPELEPNTPERITPQKIDFAINAPEPPTQGAEENFATFFPEAISRVFPEAVEENFRNIPKHKSCRRAIAYFCCT